jgi:predicted transport protein
MSDLKLFRTTNGVATELPGSSMALEKQLQTLIENNMPILFGARFLASEFSTGAKHKGRIDSLGLDENGSPVIFEYKRTSTENVINQGLFYLDWLLDHRGDFEAVVSKALGHSTDVDWSSPRLVCVAGGFDRYDEYAVQQINRTIELVRYRDFGGELLALELLTNSSSGPSGAPGAATSPAGPPKPGGGEKTVGEYLVAAPSTLKTLFDDLDALLLSLGDDVQKTERKLYFAYKRLKNFACVEVHPQKHNLLVYLKVDPQTVELVDGFSRDVSAIGHFGTGDLEVRITSSERLVQAEPLIRKSYEAS